MKTETVNISKIKSNPNNPRTIRDEKFKNLVQSIKDFPEMLNIRPKAKMIESVWPQYSKTVIRFNRHHHLINWKIFKKK